MRPLPDLTADSLGAELRRAAAEVPDLPFIRMASGEWTYRQLDEHSDRVAAGLHAHGVCQGDRVTLMLPNCLEMAVLWFALAKLGAVAAPVNTSFRAAALANAVQLADSRVAVVHASLYDHWVQAQQLVPCVTKLFLVGTLVQQSGAVPVAATAMSRFESPDTPPAKSPAKSPCPVLRAPAPSLPAWLPYAALSAVEPTAQTLPQPCVLPDALCLLLYTSGTTGRSKAAMISHRFVLAHAQLFIEGLELRSDDVLYCPYPMFHLDATVMTMAPALLLRGVAAIGERFSVSRYWSELRALKATVFDFMGATLTMLWKQAPAVHDRDHRARLGWGVPLPSFAPEFEQRFGCRLVEMYGSTEAGGVAYTPLHAPRRPGSCGKPSTAFRVRLADGHGREVAVGEPGELLIRPEQPSLLMQGYYGMPEATLSAFKDLWFHTGDVLRQDEDGYLYFVGRSKDMVRRRGENISSAEVEMGLESHPGVLECAVFGVPSDLSEEEVMACVVRRGAAPITAPDLAAHCASVMARFMVPRYIRFMDSLPKTPTDKVEKFKLQSAGVTADTWDREVAALPLSAGSQRTA